MGNLKLGRNDICSCGSGKKYKRCCVVTGRFSNDNPLIPQERIQKSMLDLKERVLDNMGGTCIMHEGELGTKMSEIILDLADELLEIAKTKSQYDKAIAITCIAWNIATLNSSENKQSLEQGLHKMDEQLYQEDALKIIKALVEKKNRLYPDVNRIILDYDLIGNKHNFHLNVISTISEQEIAELDFEKV